MIRAFELIDMVRAYNAGADEALLDRAYVFAMKAHGAQTRANGEPYFNHPIEVAAILTELRLDDATIVTALLHDTIEDTDVTAEEISERFSPEIAQLVDGVTKLSKLALVSRERAQAENFRKLLMAMAKDPRVLLVKMADRLHNMRTINHLPEHKRARIAQETLEIFAPLAGRMGMQRIRDELEDLAFAVLSPEARVSVMRRFVHLKQTQDLGVMSEIEDMLREMLVAAGLAVAKVYGREKRPYAIWRKSQEKGVAFEQLSDIMGFRVVLETEAECYQALGVIHSAFTAVPYRFKDYISAPKVNGYRSLHTAVIGPDGARIEVQIRTLQMHEVAETGVAAHWSYKEGVRQSNPFAVDPFRWLRDLVERVESGAPAEDDPEDILEDAKRELSFDQVFCFTPRGKVISLPRGATALDFAYAIHTDVGHSAVGVKINGKRVALGATLRNGQTVEILQSEGQEPSPIWRQFVKTGRARAAIRRTLRAIEKRQAAERGEHLLRLAYDRAGARWSDKALETAAQRLGAADRATMLADIGEARLTPSKALAAVYPELAAAAEAEMTAEAGAPGSPGAGDSAR
ncbi:MAG: RelA/SpoT family protein, partial [Pseudomonadota bacterium]